MLDATPALRAYALLRNRALRAAAARLPEVQEGELLKLVRVAAGTRFGRDHGFAEIKSVRDFQQRVPLRTYDDFWRDYWQSDFPRLRDVSWPGLVPCYAVSSGTSTGRTKYIPYTGEMTASNRKAGLDLLVFHLNNRPDSRIFAGRSFMLGGSTDLTDHGDGVFSGDLSGIAVRTLPWWAKQRYFPPEDLALLKNWEEKIAVLARESLSARIRMLSGVPSWLLIFFRELFNLRPEAGGKLAGVYPDLEMLVHGGVNFTPYHKTFLELLEGSRAELREVYPASEGFIAVADRGYGEGLRVIADHGIFFEFVPLEELSSPNPTRHWVRDIIPDVNYAVVLTTCAGLWSYVLGDTVKFVETSPPRLLVTGRTSYYLSAFGEHLTGDEVERAVSRAAEQSGITVTDFSVGPVYPEQAGELGGHLFVVETPGPFVLSAEQSSVLGERIDTLLSELNEDYEAHRASGFGLNPPRVLTVPEGTFAGWMKRRGKLGGQNKVPRIITDRELLSDLAEFASEQIRDMKGA